MTEARDVEFIGMIQPRAQSEIHPRCRLKTVGGI